MAETSGRSVQCVVVTPERTVVDVSVDFVSIPMYDGELGVLPGRAPLVGRLGPGELRTRRGNDVQRYFVDGGFAQVNNNIVTVLTPRAQRAEEIDTQVATRTLQNPPDGEARAKNQERARVQLRVAQRAGRGS
jgi:F-type H+-transporting ATPase subunit epsilon